jgi:hypothetical protein
MLCIYGMSVFQTRCQLDGLAHILCSLVRSEVETDGLVLASERRRWTCSMTGCKSQLGS